MFESIDPTKPQDRNRAILRSTLEPEARLVALAIADHMDGDGEAWPCGATLARETGYCERTVLDVISHGLETGWLACRWLTGRRRVLRVVWDRLNDDARPSRNTGGRKVRKVTDPERGAGSIQNGALEGDVVFQRPVPVRSSAPCRNDSAPGAGSIQNGAPPKQTNEATSEATSEATTTKLPSKWDDLFPAEVTTTDAPPVAAVEPTTEADPIADAWTALVAWTPRPSAWKLTAQRRTRLRALTKEHGAPALLTVAAWMTTDHDRAKFLRDRGDPDTLLRGANFATYLALAESGPANDSPTPKNGQSHNIFRRLLQ